MVCYAEECGTFAILSTSTDDEFLQDEIRAATVKQRLRPHFTCSSRRANLSRVGYDIHPALRALWNEAEEWHLLSTDHCDVYGFNIWPPAWLEETSDMVFGGAEARKKWLIKQQRVGEFRDNANWSCASDGWVCCMAFSEFDYLLVSSDKGNERFGHVHHITSNQVGKEAYCCNMDELLHHLANFVEEGKMKRKRKNEGKSYRDHGDRSALTRPLKLLRKSVIDAMMRQDVAVKVQKR